MELLRRRHMRLILPDIGRKLLLINQRTHAHHKKLIEVTLINRRKRQALTQWREIALRLFKHPLVEFQPGQFPVHEDAFAASGFHVC